MIIDDLIAAAEAKAAELEAACRAIAEADGAEAASARDSAQRAAKNVSGVTAALQACRLALAHHRRPKGLMVTVEWDGHGTRTPFQREVVRRTDSSVFLRNDVRYTLKDGRSVAKSSYLDGGGWRIVYTDLVRIREMPVGENEVSRALKAIDKGSGK